MCDLFQLVVAAEQVHPDYLALMSSVYHTGARQIMNELVDRAGDPNGNFISDFQSDGFYSRMFELACQAYLESIGLFIDHTNESPDFLVSNEHCTVGVEITTANPRDRRSTDITAGGLNNLSFLEINRKCQDEFPVRIGRILEKKRKKRYWELEHCQGIPFIIIVGPFHEAGSQFFIDESLARYLYGIETFPDWEMHNGLLVRFTKIDRHEYNGISINSNFFGQKESGYISAVVYANSFSVTKFVRMAMQAGLQSDLQMTRKGTEVVQRSTYEFDYLDFQYEVSTASDYKETWWEGVTIFMNPNAKNPLPTEFFKCSSSFQAKNGFPERSLFGFHPLVSISLAYPEKELD